MNYHNITKDDMLNGSGLRVVLWLAGCEHHCEGCQNPQTWSADGGIKFDADAKAEIWEELAKPYISGITISGGDGLFPDNIDEITLLLSEIKKEFPTKTVWIYTGYDFEAVKNFPIMQYCDVLVDGRFVKEQLDLKAHWVGSTNQKVIKVQESLKTNSIVLFE